jgi:hypothetical protein
VEEIKNPELKEKIDKLIILPQIEIDSELEKTNKVELKKYEKLENEFDLTNKAYTQYLKDS